MTPEQHRQRFEQAQVMRISDFEKLKRGEIVRLHYNDHNKGSFYWVHDRVEGEDVYGRFVFEGESQDEAPEVDRYLYEFMGYVCRGSGAEPVCREMPEDDPDDEGGVWCETVHAIANGTRRA